MIYNFTSDEKYFSISTNLLINGNEEEIFPKFEQGVAILVNFCYPSIFWQVLKKDIELTSALIWH